MTREPYDLLDHAALLGQASPRPDALAKLAGVGYPSDRQHPDALFGVILGSPHPHARIRAIDIRSALSMPGVETVITASDITGERRYGLRHVDRPVFCDDKVRCVGDPVAAVAARTLAEAHAALSAIRVDYEPLPVVDDATAALKSDAEPVHTDGNLLHELSYHNGQLERARQGCAHVVEAVYHTPRQMHAFLETEAGIAEPDGAGNLTLYVGCQNPERDRQVLAGILGIPAERVRVVGTPVGGSYGGKDELTIQPILALLALRTGRPVRLRLSRAESVDLGVKRHPMRIAMRTGCDAQGQLLFHEADIVADTGAYATHGPEVLDAAVEHAGGPYRYEAVALRGRLAYTNNGIAGAFRGFGAMQTQFALERQIDKLAALTQLDPAEFRARNLAAPDAPGPLGQTVAPFDGPHRALELARRHPLWTGPHAWRDERYRYGVGLTLVHRSDGFGKGGPQGGAIEIELTDDDWIEIRSSFTEMGQNLVDVVGRLAARHLGCDATRVRAVLGDSALTPDSGPTAASRATALLDRALRDAATPWHNALQAGQRPHLHIPFMAEETPSDVQAAHFLFGALAAVARVRVDTWTGIVRVQKLAQFCALGPVASPMGLLGQIEGGALMGIGAAVMEDLPVRDGRYQMHNLDTYLIPTLQDAPDYEVNAIQALLPGDPYGPRGAGEIGVNAAAPAVANAIATATGMAVNTIPVRPDDVLDFLESHAS